MAPIVLGPPRRIAFVIDQPVTEPAALNDPLAHVVPDGTAAARAKHEEGIINDQHVVQVGGRASGVERVAAHLGKAAAGALASGKSAISGGDPEVTSGVLRDATDMLTTQAIRCGHEPFDALAVVAVQPAFGTDPDVAIDILVDAGDRVVAQPIIRGDVLESQLLSAHDGTGEAGGYRNEPASDHLCEDRKEPP